MAVMASPTPRRSTSPASAAGGSDRGDATVPDAHRDLERQLAQGPPGQGRAVAGARGAGRPAHPGDEARRRRRAGDALRDGRLRPGPPRRGSLERRRDRRPPGLGVDGRRSRTSATAPSATAAPGRPCSWRGGLRPVGRGADGVGAGRPGRRAGGVPDRQPLRPERASRRLAVLRRQAALVRAARALAGRDRRRRPPRRSAATSTSPRPTTTSGTRRRSTAGPTSRSPSGQRSAPSSTGASSTPTGRERPEPRPLHLVGLPGRQLPQEPRHADRPPPRQPRRSPSGSSGPRSTARRARARRSRPTTPRSSSTSTRPAGRSTPAGPGRCRGSRLARSRPGDELDTVSDRARRAPVALDGTRRMHVREPSRRLPRMTVSEAVPEIRLSGVSKRFRDVRAVDDISLEIRPGSSSRCSARPAAARRRPSG